MKLNDSGNTVLLEINKFRIDGNRVFSTREYHWQLLSLSLQEYH
ncbi:hypothetical protein BA1DRAFT_02695 [Photorhabdus aegyptia]|uniref:Uncharacterized protein n=1 Tax=Photorhabdus aegyptia TaxID=2805098 RepID=A0A022PGU6_9GAMM|nr:hypothetical protein BA1DRAFT_02695 [Photorhabdus aegyptia]